MIQSQRSLDILCIGTLPPHPGGSAVSCGQLVVELAGIGHTIRVVAPITEDVLRSGDRFAATHSTIAVTRFQVPNDYVVTYVAPSEGYERAEREQLRRIVLTMVQHNRPDLLLVCRDAFARYAPALAADLDLPSVLLVRGSPTVQMLKGTYPEEQARYLLQQYAKVDLIITNAGHLARGLLGLGFRNVCTIPNAIDVEQFSPRPGDEALRRKLRIEQDDVVIMLVANLHPRKRPLDLVRSAQAALRRNRRLVFVIVGDGVLRQSVEDACRAAGVLDRFRFAGWVDYEQVPDYINLADIVVLPSEDEGLARVYLEAQACGRVLIASDIPPAREVISYGEDGLLFAVGDTCDLAEKILLAAGDPTLRAAIGRKARQRVRAHSIQDAAADYSRQLQLVVRRHGSRVSPVCH
jgi:glycosyltransferase involved in cell wall biosynthesis